jgi:hypothetical protein
MRFYDLVSERGYLSGAEREAVVFDASEIAGELDKLESVGEGTSYPRESYGICAPPFRDRYFWIEAVTSPDPDHYRWEEDIRKSLSSRLGKEGPRQAIEEFSGSLVSRGALCIARDYEDSAEANQFRREAGEDYDNGRWLVIVKGFFSMSNTKNIAEGKILDLSARAYVIIGRDGTLLSNPETTFVEVFGSDPTMARLYAGGVTNMIPFTLLALSFLHKRTEVDHIRPNRIERKRAARVLGQKRGAYPLRDYYMLRVKPHNEEQTPLNDPSQIRPVLDPSGSAKRAHSVRGHFRRVPDSGLFGRGLYAGELIWIPDHMRGKGSLGEVSKDYRISGE